MLLMLYLPLLDICANNAVQEQKSFPKEMYFKSKQKILQVTLEVTSNDIIAEDGREWFMIEYKFKKKCIFLSTT